VVASKVRSSGGDMPLADAVQMYHAAASLNYLDEGMQAVLSRVIGAASPQDFSLQVRLDEGSRRHPRTEHFVCLLVAKTCITLAPCTKLLCCKVANNVPRLCLAWSQSLGNAAWAAATLDEEDEVLHEALEQAISVRFEELMLGKEVNCNSNGVGGSRQGQDAAKAVGMGDDVDGLDGDSVVVAAVKKPRATYQDLQELRQVHQYMLTRKLAASPPTGPDKNGQEMDRQVTFQPTAGSNFGRKQEEVCRRYDSRRALLTAHYTLNPKP
jgi:hypothetical protein